MQPRRVWSDKLECWTLQFVPPGNSDNQALSNTIGEIVLPDYDPARASAALNDLNTVLKAIDRGKEYSSDQLHREFDPWVARAISRYRSTAPAFASPSEPISSQLNHTSDREQSRQVRDRFIPLPQASEGYQRVLIIGATGSGKTTLLRQLIGTHPTRELFPSTSTAKTTIADLEIITREDRSFTSVVTFFSREHTQSLVEDCVIQSTMSAYYGSSEVQIAKDFVQHREQRLRLRYILGTPSVLQPKFEQRRDGGPESVEQVRFTRKIDAHVTSIKHLANRIRRTIRLSGAGVENKPTGSMDEEELLDQTIRADNEFANLVFRIMRDIQSRFRLIDAGKITYSPDEWPIAWRHSTADRGEFLRDISWFSSNASSRFGRLVTPLVDGIRVSGPFLPREEWYVPRTVPKLILTDGEGLGHTSDTVSSLPSRFSEQIIESDLILLVENATQPIQQAASRLALTRLFSTGIEERTYVVFTHMDQMHGDEFASSMDRIYHVEATLSQHIASIAADIQVPEHLLTRGFTERAIYLGNINKPISSQDTQTHQQLSYLMNVLTNSDPPPDQDKFPTEASLKHGSRLVSTQSNSSAVLNEVLDRASHKFHSKWGSVLGTSSGDSTARKQHWTRVKALSRHIGNLGETGYDNLRPASDLEHFLLVEINRYLHSNLPGDSADIEDRRSIAALQRQIAVRIGSLARRRLIDEQRLSWRDAYLNFNGPGSTLRRADAIEVLLKSCVTSSTKLRTGEPNRFNQDINQLIGDTFQSTIVDVHKIAPTSRTA